MAMPVKVLSRTRACGPRKPWSMEYFRKKPMPMTKMTTARRRSQVVATANSHETPWGWNSSLMMIQFQMRRRIWSVFSWRADGSASAGTSGLRAGSSSRARIGAGGGGATMGTGAGRGGAAGAGTGRGAGAGSGFLSPAARRSIRRCRLFRRENWWSWRRRILWRRTSVQTGKARKTKMVSGISSASIGPPGMARRGRRHRQRRYGKWRGRDKGKGGRKAGGAGAVLRGGAGWG